MLFSTVCTTIILGVIYVNQDALFDPEQWRKAPQGFRDIAWQVREYLR